MFALSYLRQELRRRLGRTILTVLGLGIGVALVVATTALGAGLDKAQQQVLGPLSGVATDITVTKDPTPFSGDGPIGLDTDLSKLGKAGEEFSTESFFSSQGTLTADDRDAIRDTGGVTDTSSALVLQGIHQEGTIPKITAQVETGGETVSQDIEPMTEAEQTAFRECMEKSAGANEQPEQGGPPGAVRINTECLPERFREGGRVEFRVPRRIIEQDVDTPETDINSNTYTIAGIEPDSDINLISAAQVTDGAFLGKTGEAMVSESYAESKNVKIGSTIDLKDKTYKIVGLVTPPLGGNAADIYTTLADLQELSEREGQTNVVLARADDASNVGSVSTKIEDNVAGSNVSDASDLAEQVAGSLVDSGNLIRRLGFVLAVVGIAAAVLIAALLTLSSIAKRTRELGTLKAIGWRPRMIVRQILAESAAQGVLGGLVGIGLGIGAAAVLGAVAPSLSARAVSTGGGPGSFGFGRFGDAAQAATEAVKLTAPVSVSIVLLAAGLAVLGGLLAGAIGAMRAARLRPADAMREVS